MTTASTACSRLAGTMFSLRRPSPPSMARMLVASCPSVEPIPPTIRVISAISSNVARPAPDRMTEICSSRVSPMPSNCLRVLPVVWRGENRCSQPSLNSWVSK
ncbi:hypothetical protein D3C76_1337450 [compost metagenome]